jgi:hypothetical protein
MSLDGPSRRIISEPLEAPVTPEPGRPPEPEPGEQTREPAATPEPAWRDE